MWLRGLEAPSVAPEYIPGHWVELSRIDGSSSANLDHWVKGWSFFRVGDAPEGQLSLLNTPPNSIF